MNPVYVFRCHGCEGYLGEKDVVLAENLAIGRYTGLSEEQPVAELEHPVEQVVWGEYLIPAGIPSVESRRTGEFAFGQRLAAQEARPTLHLDVTLLVTCSQESVEFGGEVTDQDL